MRRATGRARLSCKQAPFQKREENQAHQNPSDQAEDQSLHCAAPARKQPVGLAKQKSENQGAVREGQYPWRGRANGAADQIAEQPLQVVIGLKRRQETRPGLQNHEAGMCCTSSQACGIDGQILARIEERSE